MKESEGDRLKCAVCESILSTAARSPFPKGGRQRGGGFAAKKKANPASLRSAAPSKGRGSRGYSLLPLEGGVPKGRRLDGESGISVSQPSPRGKAKRRRLLRKKRKPTPPRCARQPLPREGARVDTPSFLWKEVSRRGGGWMGKAVFPYHSLHQGGRQRGGGFSAKKGSQPRLAALGSPFQGKGLAWILPPSSGRRCPEGAEVGWG